MNSFHRAYLERMAHFKLNRFFAPPRINLTQQMLDVDVDVVKWRAQANASMPLCCRNQQQGFCCT